MLTVKLVGPDHPDVAAIWLFSAHNYMGRFEEVEHYYQRAVEIFEMELGLNDPNVAKTMSDLVRIINFR